jgi:DNA-binding NarL/FixJ family response regulator
VDAVRLAHAGRPCIDPQIRERLLQTRDLPALTSREIQVLKLVAEGLRNHEIAKNLGLSLNTVKVHVNRILEKLDAQDRTEAVTRALRRGLISLP